MPTNFEPPRFLPNDVVFAIPDSRAPWIDSADAIGYYKISKVEIVPEFVGSDKRRYRYYAIIALAAHLEISLNEVFANKEEYFEWVKIREFPYMSPKESK